MPKHIGIVGCSPEGTALCYREIFRHAKRLLGDRGHPVVSIHNEPLERYVDAVLKDDWHTVGDLLTRSARFLAACGAEFCIVPDNLMQHGVHLAEGGSPIPWLTMTDMVTRAVESDQRQVVGLIGTKMVMYGSTYQTALGLMGVRVLIPEDTEAESLNSIIFRELVFGGPSPSPGAAGRGDRPPAGRPRVRGGGPGVREAALVISAENSPVPVYDATDLLAEGAVRYAASLTAS